MATKCVKMCRNGDGFFPPVNVVINPRDIRNMDAFLDHVTHATRMKNAARRVCTPRKGHRVEDLTKLVAGEMYVAVGQEGFKTIKYGSIQLRRPVLRRRELKIEPVKHSRILMSARCRKVALWESSGLKTIHVYRNGDDRSPSHKILLDRRILLQMDKVLEHVTERVKLESGAVFGLYTLLGKEVNSPSQLVTGEKYVAVGHGKRFKRTAYNDNQKVSPNNSPRRATVKYKVVAKTKQYLLSGITEIKKEKVFVEQGSGNEVEAKVAVQKPQETAANTSRPVEDHTDIRNDEKDDSKPHNDVYKASGAKSEKAKQVEDDREVKVEKLIDQLPAEEVTEETVEEDTEETVEEDTEGTVEDDQSDSEDSQNTENNESTEKPQDQVRPALNNEEETVEGEDNTQE